MTMETDGPEADPDWAARPADRVLARAIRELFGARDRHLRSILPALGVSQREFTALSHLYFHTGATPGELARTLVLTPGTVTVLTDRMIAADLVHRTRHPDDRRRQLITLTPRGRRQMQDALQPFYNAVTVAVDRTAGLDRETTAAFFTNFTEILRAGGIGPPVEWPTNHPALPEE